VCFFYVGPFVKTELLRICSMGAVTAGKTYLLPRIESAMRREGGGVSKLGMGVGLLCCQKMSDGHGGALSDGLGSYIICTCPYIHTTWRKKNRPA
jgi:hypothetical protein